VEQLKTRTHKFGGNWSIDHSERDENESDCVVGFLTPFKLEFYSNQKTIQGRATRLSTVRLLLRDNSSLL